MTTYKVLETRQIQQLSPTGASLSSYRVWVQTGLGATGSIDVTTADWTKDKLKSLLDAFAETLDLAFTITK